MLDGRSADLWQQRAMGKRHDVWHAQDVYRPRRNGEMHLQCGCSLHHCRPRMRQDGDGCFYQASSAPCTNGSCSGASGMGTCCTNACTSGSMQCGGGGVQTCQVGLTGCTDWKTTATCGSPLACLRSLGPPCAAPEWAAWPMPNAPIDVAAGAPNPMSYVYNGDGTVTDTVTGLMWQQNIGLPLNFSDSVNSCATLPLGGHSDWRVPSLIELASIVDFGEQEPSINSTFFPGTPGSAFWSTAPVITKTGWRRVIVFASGFSDASDPTAMLYVRCVR